MFYFRFPMLDYSQLVLPISWTNNHRAYNMVWRVYALVLLLKQGTVFGFHQQHPFTYNKLSKSVISSDVLGGGGIGPAMA